jgi:hypothetical protein
MHLVPFDQSVLCVDLWRAFSVQKITAATVSLTSVLTGEKQLYCTLLIIALVIIINIFTLFTLSHFVFF